jgi:tRNA A-37 threonylcarbamoyl transferase component Bud32
MPGKALRRLPARPPCVTITVGTRDPQPEEAPAMPILLNLSTLAVRQVLEGACHFLGYTAGEHAFDGVVRFLADRFADQSQRLPQALHRANDSAWKALEVALAGESLWNWLDKAEHKAFRAQVRAFLDATPLAGLPSHGPEFRTVCLRELRTARKAGLLTQGSLHPAELAQQAGAFARFSDPESLLGAEWQAVEVMAAELRGAGYPSVAHLVALRPDRPGSISVLVAAVRYFFRREVETDRELYQGLTWAKLEAMQQAQDHAFAALADALAAHADRVEEALGGLQETVAQTHGAVLDVQSEQQRQGQQLQEMYQAVLDLKRRHDLQSSEVRPRDSLAIGNESERRLVKTFMERFRALPPEQQQRLPALLNSLAQLEVAAGDFEGAQKDFRQVATLVSDRAAQAEAFHNAYGAALEKGDYPAALEALRQAAALDPQRFAPFPLHKYEPERILGAGGFGVAFLCRNRHTGTRLVVKTLRTDSLERQVADVFREARVLEELEHPAIIRLRDCDFADAEQKRPYLVMDYFDGMTLADQVEKHGALTAEHLLGLARPVAEALRAAHARGILHRDVKPANLLVRQEGAGWRVKLIDFGLALKETVLNTTAATPAVRARTVTGYSIGGTLDYAAPEQMGKLPGVAVGPSTDVYGFGKTCCYALFKTTQPLRKHWGSVPEALADLLEQCLQESPADRLPNFEAVLDGLAGLTGRPPVTAPTPPAVAPVKPAPAPVEPPRSPREEWWRAGVAGEVVRFEGHNEGVLAAAFSPDGREVLSGGSDGTVRLWEAQTGRELACMVGHRDKVWAVAFFPDGKRALSAGKDRSARLWDLGKGREARSFEGRTNRSLGLSADGKYALTGSVSDGMVRLWEAENGREKLRLKGHMSWVLAAAFAPTGRPGALTASADGTARLWELESGRELRRLQGHKDQVLSVAFSPTGQRALTGSADGSVRLWDLRSGKEARIWEGVSDQVWSVAFSPDGRYALWECAEAASGGRVGSVVRAGGGAWEGAEWALVLWDVEAGREAHRFKGHTAKVMSVAFSPDGRCALSGSMDGTMRLWKLPE